MMANLHTLLFDFHTLCGAWGVAVVAIILAVVLAFKLWQTRRLLACCREQLRESQQSAEMVESIVEVEMETEAKVEAEAETKAEAEAEAEVQPYQIEVEGGSIGDEIFESYADGSMTSSDRLFLKRLTSYIEKNIDSSELVVNRLCDFMGVTQLVLNKKLKLLVGMTANNLIRTVRLRRAAQLLRTARYTVSDVTYDVGFSDLRYFRECFKREFGVLPQEYKDQMQSESGDGAVEVNGEHKV